MRKGIKANDNGKRAAFFGDIVAVSGARVVGPGGGIHLGGRQMPGKLAGWRIDVEHRPAGFVRVDAKADGPTVLDGEPTGTIPALSWAEELEGGTLRFQGGIMAVTGRVHCGCL